METEHYQLAHLIYSSIGNIYLYNLLHEYALHLYDLSKEKKDYEKMSQYCDNMVIYQDSIWNLQENKEFMDMQEKYNQQKNT